MKVLCTKPFFDSDINYINERLDSGIELVFPSSYTQEDIVSASKDAEVLLGGLITEELLSEAKNLKFIQIPWTGVDRLDFSLLLKYKPIVCNSHSNSFIVAEHAIALLFDASKKLSYHDRNMREGNWNRPKPFSSNEVSPFSVKISNSKIGIIGFGSIGKNIYQMMRGFNCCFKVFNKNLNCNENNTGDIAFYSSQEINHEIKDLDFVFISVALTEDTKQMINKTFLDSMNNNGILINVSRGEVVDEEALYKALLNKTIAYAGIDTWFNYPSKNNPKQFPSARFPYHKLDNLVMSPHRAGMIQEVFPHLDDAIENINRFNSGKELINKISLTQKY